MRMNLKKSWFAFLKRNRISARNDIKCQAQLIFRFFLLSLVNTFSDIDEKSLINQRSTFFYFYGV